jgi:hypothetical protein
LGHTGVSSGFAFWQSWLSICSVSVPISGSTRIPNRIDFSASRIAASNPPQKWSESLRLSSLRVIELTFTRE